jgi:glycosyltransferase involved in cell wall biosynthesis
LVCSTIPPLLDIVEDGVSALTFPPDDPTRLAQSALGLARDEELQAQLGGRLQATVTQEFSIDRMVGRYLDVYDRTTAPRAMAV